MRLTTLFAAVAISSVLAAGAAVPTPQQADAFEQKLNTVLARGEMGASGHRTEFAGDEVNAYLQLRLSSKLPTGVAEPSVALHEQGRLSGRAVVDLDGIRKKSSGGWFDPAAYLSGKLPVTAAGTLKTDAGRGQFFLESAEISGIPIPKTLLQEVVTYYTKSPDLPNGVNLDAPFELPSGIQRIDVAANKATVLQ